MINDSEGLLFNTLVHYKMLKEAISGLLEDLDEVDQQSYNTRRIRIQLEYIKNAIYKMEQIIMLPQAPWEAIGVSRATYYRDEARAEEAKKRIERERNKYKRIVDGHLIDE